MLDLISLNSSLMSFISSRMRDCRVLSWIFSSFRSMFLILSGMLRGFCGLLDSGCLLDLAPSCLLRATKFFFINITSIPNTCPLTHKALYWAPPSQSTCVEEAGTLKGYSIIDMSKTNTSDIDKCIVSEFKNRLKKGEVELREMEAGHRHISESQKLRVLDLIMFHDIRNYQEIAQVLNKEEDLKQKMDKMNHTLMEFEKTRHSVSHRDRYLRRLKTLLKAADDNPI